MLVCHDREFLNDQINRVIAFEPEGVRFFNGNYDQYAKHRVQEKDVLENQQKKRKAEREQMERFINRFRAKATKAKAVQSRIKALEKMGDADLLTEWKQIDFCFPPTKRTSQQVLLAQDLSMQYGEKKVFDRIGMQVTRGDRIAVIGANGAGKTTLLKLLAGDMNPTSGSISYGHHVQVGYYAQHHKDALSGSSSAFEEVQCSAKDQTPLAIRSLLGALGFLGDDVDKPVSVLSGGEKARVALAKLLLHQHNLLIMDEPTNHLDLASSEKLAEALGTYDGTLIFASHNRSFANQLATRIWNVAHHQVEDYPGGINDYMESMLRRFQMPDEESVPESHDRDALTKAASKNNASIQTNFQSRTARKERKREQAKRREELRNLTYPLEQKLLSLEKKIAEIEARQEERSKALADPNTSQSSQEYADISKTFYEESVLLEQLLLEWESVGEELLQVKTKFADPGSDFDS